MGDNPERLDSEASFAALCGVSPVERSSGRRQVRRLNRGGDRQANAALHRIVFTRLRVDPRTQDYYERRIKEGKTRREVVRCPIGEALMVRPNPRGRDSLGGCWGTASLPCRARRPV
ncbi:transposase [Streptomyces mirabilis]|uniref:transposase n=1 Tax=Streptomyces mirabilis TaxID=68239 RepID=UPI003674192A